MVNVMYKKDIVSEGIGSIKRKSLVTRTIEQCLDSISENDHPLGMQSQRYNIINSFARLCLRGENFFKEGTT